MESRARVRGGGMATGSRRMFWLAALILLAVTGCDPLLALQRTTPTPTEPAPGIRLYPTYAQAGDIVTVTGNGWPAATQVYIYLTTPEPAGATTEEVAGATVDTYGRFVTSLVVPTGEMWLDSGSARVVARSQDGSKMVQAILNLKPTTRPAQATATPSLVVTPVPPTATAIEATPGSTPSPTVRTVTEVADVAAAEESVTVSGTVDLNVRLGPDVAYPVVASLRMGEPATVTGANHDGTWLRVQSSTDTETVGWVSRKFVIADDLSHVPVVAAPPLPATPTPTDTPTPTATPAATEMAVATVVGGWQGEYYDNITLSGSPAFVRTDASLDFGWGDQGPGGGLPAQFFSVRWTQAMVFSEGTYYFNVVADDGVRLWVDGSLKLDEWRDTDPTTYYPIIWLSEGTHTLKVEYYQHLANSTIQVLWHRDTAWHARYYNNRKMEDEAVLDRYEEDVNYSWGTGSPDPLVAADKFSAIWTRKYTFEEDLYVFTVDADDGVRLKVDGEVLLESWTDGTRTLRAERHFDSKGEREVRVEYYEHYGDAHIKVSWRRD